MEGENAIQIYLKESSQVKIGKVGKFPFLDLEFYDENATHIWLHGLSYTWHVSRKETVFPLVFRPYNRFWLLAPRFTR